MYRLEIKELKSEEDSPLNVASYEYKDVNEALCVISRYEEYFHDEDTHCKFKLEVLKDGLWVVWTDDEGNTADDYIVINGKPILMV